MAGLGLLNLLSGGADTGILGQLADSLSENSNSLLGLSQGGWEGFAAGSRIDNYSKQMEEAKMERAAKMQAVEAQAKALGLPPEMLGDAETVSALYRQRMTPKEPRHLSFEEQWIRSQPKEVQEQYMQRKMFGADDTKWEIKTIKNADGSENPVYFNPRTMETRPVPGYGAGNPRAAAAQAQAEQSANIVVDDIDRALDITKKSAVSLPVIGEVGGNTVTGGLGDIMKNFGGTNARDVAGLVETVKANVTFDKLQQMRKASPTGAALGAVSDTENRLLGAAVGDLQQSQSREQFERNLKRVKKIYNEVIHGPGSTDAEGNLRARPGAAPGPDRAAIEAEARRRGLIR
jgi:hypothetical protein